MLLPVERSHDSHVWVISIHPVGQHTCEVEIEIMIAQFKNKK